MADWARNLVILACLALPGGALAQDEPLLTPLDPPRSEASRDYSDSIRFGRIQSELTYIDELNGPIPMDGAPPYRPPEPEADVEWQPGQFDWRFATALAVLLAVLALLGAKFGRLGLLKAGPTQGRLADRAGATTVALADTGPVADFLALIRSMPDREAALVMLLERSLDSAAHQNGLGIRRSETARETLRRLPGTWPRLSDLRRLIMVEELVQFGGRPLADDSFEDCLGRAAAILRATPTRATA